VIASITVLDERNSFMEQTISMSSSHQIRMMVLASLFAALTAVGAYLAIPIGPVPIVLQNFFVLLAGLVLGRRWGLAAIGAYLLAGALGLPVFAAGSGGLGRIFGPTGGYLIGYLPAVVLTGFISHKGQYRALWDVVAMICAMVAVYAIGLIWLKTVTGMDWVKTISAGMLPFLIGDALKITAAVPVAKAVRPLIGLHNGYHRN
jgi:biotin transport system substrate-specific component